MNKLLGVGATALLTVTMLAGCGGGSDDSTDDSGGSYCSDVKAAVGDLTGLGDSFTSAKFSAAVAAVHSIESEAPSDIKPQWTIVASQFDSLTKALDGVGVSLEEYGQLAAGSTPAAVSPSQLTALESALKDVDTTAPAAAKDKITAQVKSECHIDLTPTTSTPTAP